MKIFATLMVTTVLLAGCSVSFDSGSDSTGKVTAGTSAKEEAVAKVATRFLTQLDEGKADATWSAASPYLHERSTKTGWVSGIDTYREAVGALKKRKIKGFGFTDTVKGVPKGNYAAVGFATVFTNAAVQEKVVLQNDHGTWRVMGYFMTKTLVGKL